MAAGIPLPASRASRVCRVYLLAAVVSSLFVISLFFGPTTRDYAFITDVSSRTKSKSIEDRVKHILKHTPLIGIFTYHFSLCLFITFLFYNTKYPSKPTYLIHLITKYEDKLQDNDNYNNTITRRPQ